MNPKNDNAKKDLLLAYSQGNITAYSPTIKTIARYLSTKYPKKNSDHQREGKNGDINGKKGDDPKSKDKANNATSIASAHVGNTATPEESTTFSGGASIGAHVSEATERSPRPTRSVEDILETHHIGDDLWGGTNPGDLSINIANSKEVMAGSHITEQHTFKF